MEQLVKLGSDIGKLWSKYGSSYLNGVKNTLVLALVATLIGCIIGFICGILQTIPHAKTDHPVKRFFLALIRVIVRIYVEVFRGTPMVLQAVFVYYGLPYFTNQQVQFTNVWMAAILVVQGNEAGNIYRHRSTTGAFQPGSSGTSRHESGISLGHCRSGSLY